MTYKIFENDVLRDATPEEVANYDRILLVAAQERKDSVRNDRNQRLMACDWTQLPDVGANINAAWISYRQALRDVPEQPGFPDNVQWPVPPT